MKVNKYIKIYFNELNNVKSYKNYNIEKFIVIALLFSFSVYTIFNLVLELHLKWR
jgi:hypothetical protein